MDNLSRYEADENPAMQKAFLLFEILADQIMTLLEEALVDFYVETYDEENLKEQVGIFQKQMGIFSEIHGWEAFENIPTGL